LWGEEPHVNTARAEGAKMTRKNHELEGTSELSEKEKQENAGI